MSSVHGLIYQYASEFVWCSLRFWCQHSCFNQNKCKKHFYFHTVNMTCRPFFGWQVSQQRIKKNKVLAKSCGSLGHKCSLWLQQSTAENAGSFSVMFQVKTPEGVNLFSIEPSHSMEINDSSYIKNYICSEPSEEQSRRKKRNRYL